MARPQGKQRILHLLAFCLGVAGPLQAGCGNAICGEGTIQQDGICVAVTPPPTNSCGAGTYYDEQSGQCRNVLIDASTGICDDETTIRQVDDGGLAHCVGQAVEIDCAKPVVCPSPESNRVSICGRVFGIHDFKPADNADSSDGTPYLTMKMIFHDAIGFVQNPEIQPLLEVPLDSCGRYVGANILRPSNGLIVVAVVDADGNTTEMYSDSGVLSPVEPGQIRQGIATYFVPREIDEGWTASAGNPFGGSTFGEKGVFHVTYVDPAASPEELQEAKPLAGKPVPGVKITSNGVVRAPDDFYFADLDPKERTTIDVGQDMTGVTGAGMIVNSALSMHSGTGGEPPGCKWAASGALAPPGVVFVGERRLECQ